MHVLDVGLLLDACPGPPLARKGLRIVALQAVPGIPGLDASQQQGNAPTTQHANLSRPRPAADSVRYISSTTQVALLLGCRPAYLSKAARNHGYSFSRTLRWIRFLHAMALLSEGCRVETMVWRLGFGDVAGWSRFTTRLVGRSPPQLPALPLCHWVRRAVDDVYLGLLATGLPRRRAGKG